MTTNGKLDTGKPDAILSVSNLTVNRGGRPLWAGIDFSVTPGTVLYVMGANGSGKTTLLTALAGIVEPEGGDILWCGRSIRTSPEYRQQMAYLAHNNGLNGDIAVAGNLEYAARLAGNTAPDRIGEAVSEVLASVGLEQYGKRMLRQLSQGQQRRVALARLLLQRTRLWLLDEPFNALDADSSERFCSILSSHLIRGGLAVISTHQTISVDAPNVGTLAL